MKSLHLSEPPLLGLLIFSDSPEDRRIAKVQLARFPRLFVAPTISEFVAQLAELPSTIAMAVAVTSKPTTERCITKFDRLRASNRLVHIHMTPNERAAAEVFFRKKTHEWVSPEEVLFSSRPDVIKGGFAGIYVSIDWRAVVSNAAFELERSLYPVHH